MTAAERPHLVVVEASRRVGLTLGETALVGALVFFATVGVGMWAMSVHTEGAFAMGIAWVLVLQRINQWVQALERDVETDGR